MKIKYIVYTTKDADSDFNIDALKCRLELDVVKLKDLFIDKKVTKVTSSGNDTRFYFQDNTYVEIYNVGCDDWFETLEIHDVDFSSRVIFNIDYEIILEMKTIHPAYNHYRENFYLHRVDINFYTYNQSLVFKYKSTDEVGFYRDKYYLMITHHEN